MSWDHLGSGAGMWQPVRQRGGIRTVGLRKASTHRARLDSDLLTHIYSFKSRSQWGGVISSCIVLDEVSKAGQISSWLSSPFVDIKIGFTPRHLTRHFISPQMAPSPSSYLPLTSCYISLWAFILTCWIYLHGLLYLLFAHWTKLIMFLAQGLDQGCQIKYKISN